MMLPFGQIQLDGLLTGVGQPKQGAGPSAQPTADGMTFESLLSLFGMGQPVQTATEAFDGLLPVGSISIEAERDSQKRLPNPADAVAAMPLTLTFESAQDLIQNSPAVKDPTPSAAFSSAVTRDGSSPLTMPVAQPWVVTMLHQQQVELQPGNYQVLKSNISDGQLFLEVAPRDKLAEPIKISIPADLLQSETPAATPKIVRTDVALQSAAKRIALEPTIGATPALESLIEKVNLRELQVSKSPSSPFAMTSDEPVALRLIGEQVGQRFVLTAKLDRTQLKATETTKSSVPMAAITNKTGFTPISQPAFAGEAVFEPRQIPRSARQVAFASQVSATTEDSAAIKELLAMPTDKPFASEQFESMLNGSKGNVVPSSIDLKAEHATARITLPQEMPSLKPDGKSVMLRIEPEHLGPAKLHLTMHHDILTAKVTVETAQAKAAVEASLDQLTDQLARAGVKVDYIDVGVRNGGAENQFLHRQAEWFRSAKPNMARLIEEPLSEIIPQVIPVRPMYVGASGVNLFA